MDNARAATYCFVGGVAEGFDMIFNNVGVVE